MREEKVYNAASVFHHSVLSTQLCPSRITGNIKSPTPLLLLLLLFSDKVGWNFDGNVPNVFFIVSGKLQWKRGNSDFSLIFSSSSYAQLGEMKSVFRIFSLDA